ncbi:hypothetical protein M3Y96_01086300 [Aphelenchoides besseyi]|nr:hypothetical protein M3Y96_01086300 [Aphelenchoides besseyi]
MSNNRLLICFVALLLLSEVEGRREYKKQYYYSGRRHAKQVHRYVRTPLDCEAHEHFQRCGNEAHCDLRCDNLFTFPVVTSSVNYEITLNEKTELLNTCIGKTGYVSLYPSYLVFFIDVKERRCLEILRNSAINTIYDESPTRFDIYVPQENEVNNRI